MCIRFAAALALSAVVAGCGGSNGGPSIQPISDQTASVGVELVFQIRASDPDGDTLTFDFSAPAIPDLKTRGNRATITSFSDGVANFRWTPNAQDRSETPYAFDFTVSDGSKTATETVQITVTDAASAGSPIFRQPLGTGTTLDLATDDCLDIPIVVEDSDSTMVTIEQQAPIIEGATLTEDGPFNASWHWCPTASQIAAQDRYMLVLTADDGQSVKRTKQYLIVLRTAPKMNCPGTAPVVTHSASANQATVSDISVSAMITDDMGLKSLPLLYYSLTQPPAPPVVSQMTQLTMTRMTGSSTSGTYVAQIPNPVAASPQGTMKTIYYLIVAQDNDDAQGSCDNTTQAPMTATYQTTITRPADAMGTTPICESCSADSQCGDADDNCIPVGATGGMFCSQSCGDAASPACPTNYTCSTAAIVSVGGLSKRQCVPSSGQCGMVMMTPCTDDALEENDGQTSITNAMSMSLSAGPHPNLSFCPSGMTAADEDWYRIPITADTMVTVNLDTLPPPMFSDVDLQLRAAPSGTTMGRVIRYSYNTTETEMVQHCAQASDGDVYVRVFSLDTPPIKENLYDLTLTKTPMSCCTDANEPDNNKVEAENLGTLTTMRMFSGLKVCTAMDEDWFKVTLAAGQKLVVDMVMTNPTTGTTTANGEDLDLHLFKTDAAAPGGVRDLMPCSPAEFGCMTSNGQGSTKTEHMTYTVPAGMGDVYYIVVKPYDGGTNQYNLTAQIMP